MRPKKHLGQNFLKSKAIVGRIAKAAQINSNDTVLEIGPGKGILTAALLESGACVFAIEKDGELIPFLQEKFAKEIEEGRLNVIEGDILIIDLKPIIKWPYKIVANIPYYITGEIIRKFLSSDSQPSSMTLLVQKEVAGRIVASDKKESILSLSVKIFGEPKIIEIVKRTMFTPAPAVDSAVIHIGNISKARLLTAGVSEENFFEVVKLGFSQKRKQLVGNLKSLDKEVILKQTLKENGFPETVRAEDLPLSVWLNIASII